MRIQLLFLSVLLACSASSSGQGISDSAWSLSGNTINSGHSIGSNNNSDLRFKTNGVERMSINGANGSLRFLRAGWTDTIFTFSNSTYGYGTSLLSHGGSSILKLVGGGLQATLVNDWNQSNYASDWRGHVFTNNGSTPVVGINLSGQLVAGNIGSVNYGNFKFQVDGDSYFKGGIHLGDGTSVPHSSSILDITSTTKGFLAPRMAAVQRLAISSPATSLFVWDADSLRYMGYNGTAWKGLKWTDEGVGGGNNLWADAGSGNLYNTSLNGNIGIGTNTPQGAFHVYSANPSSWIYFQNNAYGSPGPATNYGLAFGSNKSGGQGESIISFGTAVGSNPYLSFSSWDGTNFNERMKIASTGDVTMYKNSIIGGSLTLGGLITHSKLDVTGDVYMQGGKVGIGTNNPEGALHVLNSNPSSWIYFQNSAYGAPGPSTNSGLAFGSNKSGGYGESIISYGTSVGSNPYLAFSSWDGTNYTERMKIAPAGDVTINKNLAVSGYVATGTAIKISRSDNGGVPNSLAASIVYNTNDRIAITDHAGGTAGLEVLGIGRYHGGGDNFNFPGYGQIYTLGNFGIGVTSPQYKLDLSGTFRFADGNQAAGKVLTSDAQGLVRWADAPTSSGSIVWTDAGSGNIYKTANSGNVSIGTSTITNDKLYVENADNTNFATTLVNAGGVGRVLKLNTGGAGGQPIFDAQVGGASIFRINAAANTPDMGVLDVNYTSNTSWVGAMRATNAGSGKVLLLTTSSSDINTPIFQTKYNNATESFTVYADGHLYAAGNVGIGTSTPAYKLDVNGTARLNNSFVVNPDGTVAIGSVTSYPAGYKLAVAGNIIAEKVKVKLQSAGWPDYVFHASYKLPTLKEVEQFIKENNHLPGVPSAKEIEQNGLDLGDGQAVLLKKVEEMTLYMIEMNKRMIDMEKKVDKLAAENETLKKNAGIK